MPEDPPVTYVHVATVVREMKNTLLLSRNHGQHAMMAGLTKAILSVNASALNGLADARFSIPFLGLLDHPRHLHDV